MSEVPNIEFWVTATATGPVLYIPVSLLALRQIRVEALRRGAGVWDATSLLLATALGLVRIGLFTSDLGSSGEFGARLVEVMLLVLPMTDISDLLFRERRYARPGNAGRASDGSSDASIELDDSGGPA